jgi:hypothetical protein
LLISNVCQPGPESRHWPPHWLLLTVITFDGPAGPLPQAVRLAARPAVSAAQAAESKRLWRITIRHSSGVIRVPPRGKPG